MAHEVEQSTEFKPCTTQKKKQVSQTHNMLFQLSLLRNTLQKLLIFINKQFSFVVLSIFDSIFGEETITADDLFKGYISPLIPGF